MSYSSFQLLSMPSLLLHVINGVKYFPEMLCFKVVVFAKWHELAVNCKGIARSSSGREGNSVNYLLHFPYWTLIMALLSQLCCVPYAEASLRIAHK